MPLLYKKLSLTLTEMWGLLKQQWRTCDVDVWNNIPNFLYKLLFISEKSHVDYYFVISPPKISHHLI